MSLPSLLIYLVYKTVYFICTTAILIFTFSLWGSFNDKVIIATKNIATLLQSDQAFQLDADERYCTFFWFYFLSDPQPDVA